MTSNPNETVAGSHGIVLAGAIFGIGQEAKTLSAFIKDDGPKESFISKIKAIEDEIPNLSEQIHPPGPPSYEEACLRLDIFKDLGCLKGAFDEIIADLQDEPPDLPKIQTTFDNIGELA